jgi:hypothetical protein
LSGSVNTITRDLKEQDLLAKTDVKRRTITVRRNLEGEQQDVLVLRYESVVDASMDSMPTVPISAIGEMLSWLASSKIYRYASGKAAESAMVGILGDLVGMLTKDIPR